jgi:hypothetical protein
VDFYTLHTHNLSLPVTNATFHHSRLMGVSDIENAVSCLKSEPLKLQLLQFHLQDSLLDVIVSLGAPESKLILTGTAFGGVFNLLDSNKTLPGSPADLAEVITYQQVCKTLTKGNWTLEREEDKTGPYAFSDKKWMAFDDDTSIRIKVTRTVFVSQVLTCYT